MFRLYHITHDGLALGGMSIAFASDEQEARAKVIELLTDAQINPTVFEVKEIEIKRGAVMLWNGDY